MIVNKTRIVYLAFGVFLATLGMTLPRAIFSLTFVVAFAVLIEPRLPICSKDAKESRIDQAAIVVGAAIVILIAILIHKIR